MISRRNVLVGAAAAGAAAFAGRAASAFAKASQPATQVSFDVPPGACDCHTHIFGSSARFPFAPDRTYTPEPASVAEIRALHRALRTSRVVIVQPSVYGTDNACTLDALRQLGSSARGVAVIDDSTTDPMLDGMSRAGIRGIRLNLETTGVTDPAIARQRFQRAAERMKARGWHIQIYTRLSVIEAISDLVAGAAVRVVFDHFGGAQASLGIQQPGFATLVNLVRTGHAYVKISAPYLSSTQAPDYPDVAPLAKALLAANPERLVWGTNWPHPGARVIGGKVTDITPLRQIDDGRVFNLLPTWVPDAAQRRTILVDNPARLYGF
ncbi:MAG: amidohydrolase family protein [Acidobacteria bacterium]|nr:amidohydrolase family protein [Acidobacteriota bacterium]